MDEVGKVDAEAGSENIAGEMLEMEIEIMFLLGCEMILACKEKLRGDLSIFSRNGVYV